MSAKRYFKFAFIVWFVFGSFLFSLFYAIGQTEFEAATNSTTMRRGMYVDRMDEVIRNRAYALSVLEFAKQKDITYLALYLNSSKMDNALQEFIGLAKSIYEIKQIGFIGGDNVDFKRFSIYNKTHTLKADVFNLEYEYWNNKPRDFDKFTSILKYMRSVDAPLIETYIGWATDTEIAELANLVDRLLLHCYVKDPVTAYGYGKSRIMAAGSSLNKLNIWPIFSMESSSFYDDRPFMGDWVATHGMDKAQAIFLDGVKKETDKRLNNIVIDGFQYFSFGYMTPLICLSATALQPAAKATLIDLEQPLKITFNADVQKGTQGYITIKQSSDHAVFCKIPITDTRVTVKGNQTMIAPAKKFKPMTQYYVLWDPTCFCSNTGTLHPGLSKPDVWHFTTRGH